VDVKQLVRSEVFEILKGFAAVSFTTGSEISLMVVVELAAGSEKNTSCQKMSNKF
jgi:hypothetical protein